MKPTLLTLHNSSSEDWIERVTIPSDYELLMQFNKDDGLYQIDVEPGEELYVNLESALKKKFPMLDIDSIKVVAWCYPNDAVFAAQTKKKATTKTKSRKSLKK